MDDKAHKLAQNAGQSVRRFVKGGAVRANTNLKDVDVDIPRGLGQGSRAPVEICISP